MKRFPFLLISGLLALLVLSAPSCQSTKSSTATKMLKFNLEKGKGYDFEMQISMDQELMGQQVQLDMTTYYSLVVQEEKEGVRDLDAVIDRFKMKTGAMGMNMEVDTDEPASSDTALIKNDPIAAVKKVFSAIKGQKFTMRVNSEGKIVSVSGLENMGQKLADDMGLQGEEREDMLKGFNEKLSTEEFSQNLEKFWYIFPNKEVKVGDSWTKTRDFGGKLPATYQSSYKVTDIEGDMVTLEENSKIIVRDNEPMQVSGDIKATLVVDSRSGLVVSADQDMNLQAKAGGMSFPIKGKARIKGVAR